MVLQSQSRRPLARASHMYRRSRGKRIWPAVIAIAVLATTGFALVKFWPGQPTDQETAALGEVAGGTEFPESSGSERAASRVTFKPLDVAGARPAPIESPTRT